MTLANITKRTSEWLRPTGPMHDVVISSRVRLARNLVGMPFLPRCNETQMTEVVERLREVTMDVVRPEEGFYVDIPQASDLDRQLLVERHLISKPLADAESPRGVVISADESVAMMFNEEDHLRMQVLRSGMQLREAFEQMQGLEDRLEERLEFAFSNRFGYLTACPTNVGTGLRVSVMLHLPALKLTGEIGKAARAVRDLRMAIRGLYGEGTDALGDLFQISNQVTLGKAEDQIVEQFLSAVVPELLRYERAARDALLKNCPLETDDRVFRSLAVLRAARRVGSEEMMYLLSMVRLGVLLGRISDVELTTINELLLLGQPGHLQRMHGSESTQEKRNEWRATLLRQRLGDSQTPEE